MQPGAGGGDDGLGVGAGVLLFAPGGIGAGQCSQPGYSMFVTDMTRGIFAFYAHI